MAQTTPPTVDVLPTAPNSSTPTGFSATMDAFLAAIILFRAQVVALAANIYANCVDAFGSAAAAAASAASALVYSNSASGYAANAAGSVAAATVATNVAMWVSGASVTQNASVISPATSGTYRRKTATGSGTTDPSADPTNYLLISNYAYMQTADQTITSAGSLTIAHGLGRTPVFVQAFLKNVTTEAGYSAGDLISVPISICRQDFGGGMVNCGATITADAANLYVMFGSAPYAFFVGDKALGTAYPVTNTKWRYFVRALA